VHLLLTPSDSTGCAQLMKHVAQRHSKRMNALHGRTGTLWEGRFYSGLVPTEQNPHPAYVALAADPAARAALYAELCGSPLARSELDEIRKATRSGQSMGAARRPRGRPQKMVTVTI
jgi:putative transposase